MIALNTFLHGFTFLLAATFFALMSWVSLNFFVVEDPGSRKGKQLASLVAGGTALRVLWVLGNGRILPSAAATTTQSLAIALYLYALVMFHWAWRSNRQAPLDFIGSARQPHHLNRSGPYALVRHPFYSAYCAAWIASGLATQGNGLISALAFVLVLAYVHGALKEERLFRLGDLNEAYDEYSRSVPMLIPSLTRMVA